MGGSSGGGGQADRDRLADPRGNLGPLATRESDPLIATRSHAPAGRVDVASPSWNEALTYVCASQMALASAGEIAPSAKENEPALRISSAARTKAPSAAL